MHVENRFACEQMDLHQVPCIKMISPLGSSRMFKEFFTHRRESTAGSAEVDADRLGF